MKKTVTTVFAVLAACLLSLPAMTGEGAWFDPENCSICKNMAAEEGLMEHTKWETYMISNGAMSVMVVDPAYAEKMERASKGMEATIAKLESGEQLPLCGFCMSYGNLMMNGAEREEFMTEWGTHISLMTSDNPELVEAIQAHFEKTIVEYAKFMEAGGHGHDDHAGHAHN
ncbi:MAG: hypothetical protein R3344_01505 [Acidobacteriota bacterium]|nr:hypothetical protein [Acidobacteriota bacterium]